MGLSRSFAVTCCSLAMAGCAVGSGSAGSPARQAHQTLGHGRPPAAATIVKTVSVPAAVGNPDGMAAAAGSLWVGGYQGNAVAQLDPATGAVLKTITVGQDPLGVVAIDGFVWVADYGSGQVNRIDPATGKVTATITVGTAPDSFAEIGHRLWVFDQGDSAATVLDPASGRVLRTVRLPVKSGFAAAGAGRVWVPDLAGASHEVLGLNPATGKIAVIVHVGQYPSEVAFGFGSGWITCAGSVYRFDPATGAVQAKINASGAGFDGIAISGGAIWVGDLNNDLVDRINPATNAITGSVSVGAGPRHVIAINGDLWVALFDASAVVRLRPAS